MAKFMLNSDAFAWQMETDAALRSTVVSIVVLDRSPDWDLLVSRFERICREVPMFTERVVETLPPAPPRWEPDPDFDLGWHVRRVSAPSPGTFATVLEMARRAQMAEFDRARPLWEVTLVDGLVDGPIDGLVDGPIDGTGRGGAALLCKLHHSLSDGIGAVQLSRILFDLPAGPEATGAADHPHARSALDPLRYDLALVGRAAHLAVRSGPTALLHAVRRPVASTRATAGMAASVYRMVRPINRCGSPIMTERRLIRQLGTHEVPLSTLKTAGHLAGGTLNDAFLAGVAAGLRRYHELHGAPVDELHVTMPLSIRGAADPVGGNRLTLMRFDLPVATTDPAELVAEIHERVAAVRAEPSLPYTQAIAAGLNLLPRWYLASVLRHVDFLASDVPGLPVPVRLGEARVLMQYPFGPTIGAGVNVTLMTYVDTCALGIDVDVGAIPDFEVFHECLVAGFAEVLALAPNPAACACRIRASPFVVVWDDGPRGSAPTRGADMAEYLLYFNQQWVGDHPEEWYRPRGPLARAVTQEMKDAGVYVFAGGLEEEDGPVYSADPTSGAMVVTDGPYVETKEFLGGFAIVDVPDDEAAKHWAAKVAEACGWPHEVRRFKPRSPSTPG